MPPPSRLLALTANAVGLVAAAIVAHVGDGRQGVGEVKLIGLAVHVAIGLREDELPVSVTVHEDAVLASGIVVAGGVVFAVPSLVEGCTHEEMRHRVGLSRTDVAETAVNSPHTQTHGYRLRGRCVVAVRVEVLTTLTG